MQPNKTQATHSHTEEELRQKARQEAQPGEIRREADRSPRQGDKEAQGADSFSETKETCLLRIAYEDVIEDLEVFMLVTKDEVENEPANLDEVTELISNLETLNKNAKVRLDNLIAVLVQEDKLQEVLSIRDQFKGLNREAANTRVLLNGLRRRLRTKPEKHSSPAFSEAGSISEMSCVMSPLGASNVHGHENSQPGLPRDPYWQTRLSFTPAPREDGGFRRTFPVDSNPMCSNLPPRQENVNAQPRVYVSRDNVYRPKPPHFNGDPLTYAFWKASFRTLVESRVDNPNDLLYYLSEYTTGEAKIIVQPYFVSPRPDAYQDAWRELDRTFGKEQTIVTTLKDRLDNLPNVESNNPKSLREIYRVLRDCQIHKTAIRELSCLDDPHQIRNVVKRLPKNLRDKWDDEAYHFKNIYHDYPKFYALIEFLEFETSKMEESTDHLTERYETTAQASAREAPKSASSRTHRN